MLTVMTGPCVLEDMDTVLKIAEKLKPLSEDKRVDFYFKASFDKANRTSLSSFRGPGLDEGLKFLKKLKKSLDIKWLLIFTNHIKQHLLERLWIYFKYLLFCVVKQICL